MSVARPKLIAADQSVFDDSEFVRHVAETAFRQAAKAAVAENDRLGIVTHGAVDGKLTERVPPLALQKR